MIEALHYSPAGAKRDTKFALPAEVFDGTVNEDVLHQAVKVYLNNQRQGTAKTKGRSEVSGGVAVWAHIGGFVAGMVLVRLFENPQLVERRTMVADARGAFSQT